MKFVNALSAGFQALFDHFSGTDDSQGGVALSKVVFGADGAAPTRVTKTAPLPVDTVLAATATDRGAIIGFSGAVISTTNGSNTITLTTAPTSGSWLLGQQLTATGVPAGSYIYALVSGTQGQAGSTYTLSSSPSSLVAANATATGTGVAATSVGPQQIIPANSSRRGLQYQVQSTLANVWVNGIGAATADYRSLKIPANSYWESPSAHVGTGAIMAIADVPATPLFAREW